MLTDTLFYSRIVYDTSLSAYCQTPKDSVMTARDSANRATCRVRRQLEFKIF